MRSKIIINKLLIVFCFASFCRAGEEFMPVEQIKPGMRGVGKTVFAGEKIEEFHFEVLDIIPNFRAKRDLILVKLVGENVEKTGVVAGMSGSPTYIDGKLIGALSYSMGLFLKDPIAGITPISQMFEIIDKENVRKEELADNRGFNPLFLEMAVGVRDFKWTNFIPPQLQKIKSQTSAINEIAPLQIPLFFSGFENAAIQLSSTLFDGLGFQIFNVGGTYSNIEQNNNPTLEPGAACSVVLVEGDFGLQGTGTVTYVDGDKILGWGHPFLNFGAVGMPFGKAKILTTLASLMASTKMAALTEIIGTLHQDRTTGILGVSGDPPGLIPFKLTLQSDFQDFTEFNFRIAEDRSLHSFTPLIFAIVLSNALESARLSNSNHTLQMEGQIFLKGQKPILLQNYFSGGSPATFFTDAQEATGEIASVLGTLLSNDFETPRIEKVELKFISRHKKFLADVKRIQLDRTVVKPGDEINLSVVVKEYQGAEHKIRHSLVVSEHIRSRRIVVYAGSGRRLTQLEFRASPQKFRPKSFQQLVEMLKKKRNNNYLFFQIRQEDKGVLIEGEELPGLPPSILSVMNSQRSTGNVVSLRDRVVFEDKIKVDYSISGGRNILLKVQAKDK